MRIESVTAQAFGPLVDAQLELAPGMTVIAGVNESAKSSWHAAIYAAMVGRRRGRGATTKEERRFIEKHRPWDHPRWRVTAVVVLDDGRRVELTHDLEGKVDCRATDLALGRDVSAEIMHHGAPDGSRWLGLDSKTFAATACISQAQLLSVLASADGLQEHLQRAASTAGSDATAAAALAALDKFAREQVGRDQANSTRPLRLAKNRLAAAEAALSQALSQHEEYLSLVEDAEAARQEALTAQGRVRSAEGTARATERLVDAVREADAAAGEAERTAQARQELEAQLASQSARLTRVEQLDAAYPEGPPADHEEAEQVVRAVTEALAGWRAAPRPQPLDGRSAAELAAELAAVPPPPDGDATVSPQVRAAAGAHEQAVAVAAAHYARHPQLTASLHEREDVAAAVAAGPAVLRDLASQLSGVSNVQPDTTELDQMLDQARRRLAIARGSTSSTGHGAQPGRRRAVVAWGVAGLAAVAAAVLAVSGEFPAAAGAAAVTVAAVVAGVLLGRSGRTSERIPAGVPADVLAAERTLAELEGRRAAAVMVRERADGVRAEVEARAAARGLPTDPDRLRRLAAWAEQVAEERADMERWERHADACARDVDAAADRLEAALASRGQQVVNGAEVQEALRAYEEACTQRAEVAAAAARRESLEAALAARRREEAAVEQAMRRHRDAAERLRAAASGARVPDTGDPEDLAARLAQWQREQDAAATDREQHHRAWAELTTLLAGAGIEQLRDAVRDLEARLTEAADRVRVAAMAAAEAARLRNARAREAGISATLDEHTVAECLRSAREAVGSARETAEKATALAEKAEGVLEERARTLLPVAEAEEQVAAATAELERVTQLSRTLSLTQDFLTRAQEQVHRDIAPVIAETLRGWLPAVTEGRYVDATVDPATLEVRVCGQERRWRPAGLLSVGTAEQVYLLLRVALAKHLTAGGETCPLLLDDVTVQADDGRTRQLLELLLRLSEERQIILFAQEPVVLDWARERLTGDGRHLVLELPRLAAA